MASGLLFSTWNIGSSDKLEAVAQPIALLKLKMPFIVYRARFLVGQEHREYVGHTRALRGQSNRSALLHRSGWHKEHPPSFMVGLDETSLRLETVSEHRTKKEALAAEALAAAKRINRDVVANGLMACAVRGGPWSLMRLGGEAYKEILAVSACATTASLQTMYSGKGRLQRHLRDEDFARNTSWEPSGSKPARRSGKSGKSKDGNTKRKEKGLRYGDAGYWVHKWGHNEEAASQAQKRCRAKS